MADTIKKYCVDNLFDIRDPENNIENISIIQAPDRHNKVKNYTVCGNDWLDRDTIIPEVKAESMGIVEGVIYRSAY